MRRIVTWVEEIVQHRHCHKNRRRKHHQHQRNRPPGKEWWDANTVKALLGFFLICAILGMLSEGCKNVTKANNAPPAHDWRDR